MRALIASLCAASIAMAAGCSRNLGQPPDAETGDTLFRVELDGAAAGTTPPTGAVLFLGARPAAGGPPAYVARYTQPQLPGKFLLTERDAMRPGRTPDGPLRVFARLDADGDASTSGPRDWSAAATDAVSPAGQRIALRLRPADGQQSEFSLPIRIAAPVTPPAEAVMYVLLRRRGSNRPVGAMRLDVPRRFPVDVRLTRQHLMGDLPDALDAYQVIVKVDQDRNPMTTAPGDLEGFASATSTPVRVRLRAPENREE